MFSPTKETGYLLKRTAARLRPALSTASNNRLVGSAFTSAGGVTTASSATSLWTKHSLKPLSGASSIIDQHQFPTLPHNRLQFRYFDHRKKRKTKKKDNPFKALNIPEGDITYKDAKKRFLQIAMTNHPDTASGDVSEEDREKMRDTFIRARRAFESLAEDPMDGTAILAEDLEDAMENFDSWFKSETGFDTPFQLDMDPETMKEVARMTDKLGGGLDRDGGMWNLARMVTASVKSGSDAGAMLRLDSGDVKDKRTVNGSLRRRRRR